MIRVTNDASRRSRRSSDFEIDQGSFLDLLVLPTASGQRPYRADGAALPTRRPHCAAAPLRRQLCAIHSRTTLHILRGSAFDGRELQSDWPAQLSDRL